MTYPDPAVRAAVNTRFIALKLDHRDSAVRPLNVVWLPTLLVADRYGGIHHRSVNAVPPEDLLDVLDLGETHVRLRQGRYPLAAERVAAALDRRRAGPLTDELLFWSGIARYFAGDHDEEARDAAWSELARRYPESIWTHRIP